MLGCGPPSEPNNCLSDRTELVYEIINDFEKSLALGGITVLKFFLHISKDEQKRRLQRRLDNPDKRWKFDHGDIRERLLWDEYQEAYQDMINACSTEHAPWYVVPADKKWYRNLVVARTIADTLEAMDPRYPPRRRVWRTSRSRTRGRPIRR